MRYYVTADVHGYFDELKKALAEQGYFTDTETHKLVICGDLYDRGKQASALQAFILDLMEKEEIILIRGNHEDLALDLLRGWYDGSYLKYHHHSNGTIDTVCQLTGTTPDNLRYRPEVVEKRLADNPYIQEIIPAMKDYYETAHYIFVHGWIPCTTINLSPEQSGRRLTISSPADLPQNRAYRSGTRLLPCLRTNRFVIRTERPESRLLKPCV